MIKQAAYYKRVNCSCEKCIYNNKSSQSVCWKEGSITIVNGCCIYYDDQEDIKSAYKNKCVSE